MATTSAATDVDARWGASTSVNVRQRASKWRSNQTCLDLSVARRPLTRVNVRNVNAAALYMRLI